MKIIKKTFTAYFSRKSLAKYTKVSGLPSPKAVMTTYPPRKTAKATPFCLEKITYQGLQSQSPKGTEIRLKIIIRLFYIA